MKRDLDLIREILLVVEARGYGPSIPQLEIEGRDVHELFYHVKLLRDAGFVTADFGDGAVYVHEIAWAGHEFLDSIRDPSIWAGTKEKIGSKVASVSFDIIKSVAVELIKEALRR